MSVILRDMQTQQIKLLCKGADSIVKERIHSSNEEDL